MACVCVRECVSKKTRVSCLHKLARCDIALNTFTKSSRLLNTANPCGHLARLFISDKRLFFSFVFFNFSFINDYELMALFTIPLLLEFSVVVTQNTTHVFAMRSKPHTRAPFAFRSSVWALCAGFMSFLSMPKCQYLIRW